MAICFKSGKDKAAKGEGWALPFISCAQNTVGFLALCQLGYEKPFPFIAESFNIQTGISLHVSNLDLEQGQRQMFAFRC